MFRDFDAFMAEKSPGRPEFMLAGQKFTARSRLPWKKFSTFILNMGDDVSSKDGIDKTEEFFRMVLVAQDRQRFVDLINQDADEEEDENIVSPAQVSELLDWLLEYYTGKAQPPEESSSTEPSSSGQPSNVVSLTPRPAS